MAIRKHFKFCMKIGKFKTWGRMLALRGATLRRQCTPDPDSLGPASCELACARVRPGFQDLELRKDTVFAHSCTLHARCPANLRAPNKIGQSWVHSPSGLASVKRGNKSTSYIWLQNDISLTNLLSLCSQEIVWRSRHGILTIHFVARDTVAFNAWSHAKELFKRMNEASLDRTTWMIPQK